MFLRHLDRYTPPPPPPVAAETRALDRAAAFDEACRLANLTGDRHEVWMSHGDVSGVPKGATGYRTWRVRGVHNEASANACERYLKGGMEPGFAVGGTHRGGWDFIGFADPEES